MTKMTKEYIANFGRREMIPATKTFENKKSKKKNRQKLKAETRRMMYE